MHIVSYEHFNIEFLHICSLANSDDLYKMTLGYSAMTQDLHSSHLNSICTLWIIVKSLISHFQKINQYLFLFISKIQQNFGSLCTKKVSLSMILPEHPGMYLYQIAAKSLPQEEF